MHIYLYIYIYYIHIYTHKHICEIGPTGDGNTSVFDFNGDVLFDESRKVECIYELAGLGVKHDIHLRPQCDLLSHLGVSACNFKCGVGGCGEGPCVRHGVPVTCLRRGRDHRETDTIPAA